VAKHTNVQETRIDIEETETYLVEILETGIGIYGFRLINKRPNGKTNTQATIWISKERLAEAISRSKDGSSFEKLLKTSNQEEKSKKQIEDIEKFGGSQNVQ